MAKLRKVTANLPEDAVASAQRLTGKGITLTLIAALNALERQAHRSALSHLRGKVHFDLALRETRR